MCSALWIGLKTFVHDAVRLRQAAHLVNNFFFPTGPIAAFESHLFFCPIYWKLYSECDLNSNFLNFKIGDSGGPLIIKHKGRFTLVGITSAGFGCGIDHQPGIYHNIQLTSKWIQEVIY